MVRSSLKRDCPTCGKTIEYKYKPNYLKAVRKSTVCASCRATHPTSYFWNKVYKEPRGCWIWLGGVNSGGYGLFKKKGFCTTAHRYSYLVANHLSSTNLHVLHKCDNRKCVNPKHLFLGTQADNVADMVSKGRNSTARGERNYNAKLSPKDIQSIRQLRKEGLSQQKIADQFGVSQSMIGYIVRNENWKHI